MAKLGEDVLEWQTERLVQWLQQQTTRNLELDFVNELVVIQTLMADQEGMNDCVGPFTLKKINGRSLVNLTELDIKSLHRVSHESKKKLIKSIERFKRKKKEKMAAMFGGQRQLQTVGKPKHSSFCQEDDAASDDEGWGSDEWDSDGSQDASSESDNGEYLEPEEDLSKTGSLGREAVSSVPTGLVAQLRAGIASSLSRTHKAAAPQQYQDDEDIYDEPPEEEELYDEPSDSSGGAVVVRPPKKPPKLEERGEYLQPREMDGDQELYETPLEEEESPKPPARPSKSNRFIPTKVAQGNKFVPVNNNKDDEGEMYDVPELEDHDEEDSYEIPGEQTAPPPRPPKGSATVNPVKPQAKPFPPAQKPMISPGKPLFKGPPPQPSSQPQATPTRFTRPQQISLTSQGTPFRPQPPPLTRPPPPGKRPDFPPKNTPNTFNPAGQGRYPGRQVGSPPASPVKSASENIAPGPGPKPVPRAGILNKKEPPEAPSRSPSGPPLPPASHRKQAPLPTERPPLPEPKASPAVEPMLSNQKSLPSVPSPQKIEAVPPRPPKAGQPAGSQQPTLPPRHPGDHQRQGVPLPATPPASSRDLREQSSASSIESTSADEPIISLQHLPKPGKRSLPAVPPSSGSKSSKELMREAPWFQGPVDRKAVEASLRQLNKNGAFLVRNSTRSPNDYSMSLIYSGNVRHLRIPYKNNKYVLGDSGIQQFDSIIDLVNYYRQNEVDLKTGGKTKLTIACQVYKS